MMNDFSKLLLLLTAAGLLVPLGPPGELLLEQESDLTISTTKVGPSLSEIIQSTEQSVKRLQAELDAEGELSEEKLLNALEEEYAAALGLSASSPHESPQLLVLALGARSSLQKCIAARARIERFLNEHEHCLNEIRLERIRRFGRDRESAQTINGHR